MLLESDQNITLGELVGIRAVQTPNDVFAFFQDHDDLTCGQLDTRATNVMRHLARHGIGPGSIVFHVFAPSPDQLISLVACWRLGAVVAPVDRFMAPEAMVGLIEKLRPDLIILDSSLPNGADFECQAQRAGTRVYVSQSCDLSDDTGSFTAPEISPESAALILFTSGSTGLPKGVTQTHTTLLEGARNVIRAKHLQAGNRVLCVLPLSHMNGLVTTFITPLLSLGSVVYMQQPFSPQAAASLIDSHQVTWFSAVPTHYNMMVSPPLPQGSYSFETLEFCRSASAPLPVRILNAFESHYGIPIIETMGMTETAGQIFSNPMPPAERKAGYVGLPVGYDIKIIDADGVLTSPGEVGALLVRGKAMMTGYWHDEVETAKAIGTDGWLQTGDLARIDADGFVQLMGRTKDIAIFCGLNISLRSIEDRIHDTGLVSDVACVPVQHELFGELVGMYVIPEKGEHAEGEFIEIAEVLRHQASLELPNPQALSEITFVDAFPRSGANKVLKGRLVEANVVYRYCGALTDDPKALLASVLGIAEDEVHEGMRLGSIRRWDSLASVALIAAVETVLRRQLENHEIAALRSYKGLEAVLLGQLQSSSEGGKRAKGDMDRLMDKLKAAGYGEYPVTYLIIGYEYCLRNGVTDPEVFIDHLLQNLPSGANLLMNTYTWAFCEGKPYHHIGSRCEVGLINELFRKRAHVMRSRHPIYSYAIYGPDSEALGSQETTDCWGPGSVTFRLGQMEGVRVVTAGIGELRGALLRANPIMHAVEQQFNVPYRYAKEFKGLADFGEGSVAYTATMMVRELERDVINSWLPAHRALSAKKKIYMDDSQELYAYDNKTLYEVSCDLISDDIWVFLENRHDWEK